MKTKKQKPAGHRYTTLKQICKLIQGHMVSNLAKEHGVDVQSRTFTPWSHVVSLLYAHLAHALGLNAVRWQIWTELLVHLLMHYLAFMHGWKHSFKRLFTVTKASLWRRWNLPTLLESYGTAICSKRGTIINFQQKIEIDSMKRTAKTLTKTGVYTPSTSSMGG